MAPYIFVSILLRTSERNNWLKVENVCLQIDLGACLTQFIALAQPLLTSLEKSIYFKMTGVELYFGIFSYNEVWTYGASYSFVKHKV